MKIRAYILSICLFFCCCLLPAGADAKTYKECGFMTRSGLFIASIVTTPLYALCKLPLAAAGAVVSAPVNFFTMRYKGEFAENFALKTMTGDWYITPSVLHGDRQLAYFGSTD